MTKNRLSKKRYSIQINNSLILGSNIGGVNNLIEGSQIIIKEIPFIKELLFEYKNLIEQKENIIREQNKIIYELKKHICEINKEKVLLLKL